jgi:hypothetical protein
MKKEDGFYFLPKKWLGDASIIAMDWDCKGMHLHLMAIAWQQPLKGHLIDDDKLICKLLGNPDVSDWEGRIKPQIFSAWKKKNIKEDGIEKTYWYQPGIIKTARDMDNEGIKTPAVKKSRKKKIEIVTDAEFQGFNLASILKSKASTTILYEPITKEDSITIWSMGVNLLKQPGETESKVRGFIKNQINQFGEKPVADAITQFSLLHKKPVDTYSYFVGILKKQQTQTEQPKKTGRGFVSL